MDKIKEKTKEQRVKQIYNKFKKIFKKLPPEEFKLADDLLKKSAYMNVTLEDMQEQIDADGLMVTEKNGNGITSTQEHKLLKVYNTMVKNYSTILKQLTDMLPKENAEEADEFLAFVKKKP